MLTYLFNIKYNDFFLELNIKYDIKNGRGNQPHGKDHDKQYKTLVCIINSTNYILVEKNYPGAATIFLPNPT